jgi:cyanosortase A-associated protein
LYARILEIYKTDTGTNNKRGIVKMSSKFRLVFIKIQFAFIVIVLLKLIFQPIVKLDRLNSFVFPQAVPLAEWQLLKSKPLLSLPYKNNEFIAGKYIAGNYYQYKQNNLSLNIEISYWIDTDGNLKSFIKNYTGELLPVLYKQEEIGFYSMFVHQQKAHLTACINPRGYSTVTTDQFKRNVWIYSINSKQIISWLTSRSELVDKRCLWTHFSLALNNYSAESAYQILENAWFDWYYWWSSNFPDR